MSGGLSLHRPNYVLPLTWTSGSNANVENELKFQISLRYRVGTWPLYAGYTQTGYMQWFSETSTSSIRAVQEVREVNFNPEAWYRIERGQLGLENLGTDIGFEHESNGDAPPASRSWDRLYIRPFVDNGPWDLSLKLWYRIPEEEKDEPTSAVGDANPEILDFYGHHELRIGYTFANNSRVNLMTRYAFGHGRGTARLRLAYPTPLETSFFYIEHFGGYGESLNTFKTKRSRTGIGFAWLH